MDVSLTRSYCKDRGSLLREPREIFILVAHVAFSAEDLWVIEAHNLHRHLILDRTPPWYAGELRNAERRAADDPEFEWPDYLPPAIPPQWRLTVKRLLADPEYTVTFDSAQELHEFEPRLMAAFAQFGRFLRECGCRPETIWRRF